MTPHPHDNDLGLAPDPHGYPVETVHLEPDEDPRPTRKQLAFLRALADRTGQTFVYPRTISQASAEIRRLKAANRSTRVERALDRFDDRPDREAREDSVAIRGFELIGHGSSCTWSQRS